MANIVIVDCNTGNQQNLKLDAAGNTTTSGIDTSNLASEVQAAFSNGATLSKASVCGKGFGAGTGVVKALSEKGATGRQVNPQTAKKIYNGCGGSGPFVATTQLAWSLNVSINSTGTATINCQCLDCECKACNGACTGPGTHTDTKNGPSTSGQMLCSASYMLCVESAKPINQNIKGNHN